MSGERRRPAPTGGGGNALYGLGLLGALIAYWQQAHSLGGHVVGVLKAFVWPAFLVYDAYQAIRR